METEKNDRQQKVIRSSWSVGLLVGIIGVTKKRSDKYHKYPYT